MNALWIDVPEWFLEERRAMGHDKMDELWEGVLHMVPPASSRRGFITGELLVAIRSMAKRRRLIAAPDGMGLYAPDTDPKSWRIPDASIARPEHVSERGLESAVLVVEVRSPNDESYEKLPFYARVGVQEVWIVEPVSRIVELYTIVDGAFALLPWSRVQRSPALGAALETVAGPKLRITDGDEIVEI